MAISRALCQQVHYERTSFFQDVILEADTGLDHKSVSSIIIYSTGAVQVPSRGHSRGLHQS